MHMRKQKTTMEIDTLVFAEAEIKFNTATPAPKIQMSPAETPGPHYLNYFAGIYVFFFLTRLSYTAGDLLLVYTSPCSFPPPHLPFSNSKHSLLQIPVITTVRTADFTLSSFQENR